MNTDRFYAFLKTPSLLNASSLADISELAQAHPYAENLRLLHLLNLISTHDHAATDALKTAALYTSERAQLKRWVDYINNPPTPQSTTASAPHTASAGLKQNKEALLSLLRKRMKDFEQQKQHDSEATAPISAPKETLIERFLAQQPTISRPESNSFFDPQQEAIESSKDDASDLVTETLANIYAQQGHYQKAIIIFRKLILKYPEKSAFFAARIEELNKNIKNL